MPKVSVIIPVCNQEPYLAECLDTVLSQTLREIEVICVDDGSTDGSGRLLDEFAVRDSRVTVIHQANAGAGPARNAGIDRARGAFIAFMDPDDKYPDCSVLADLVAGAESAGVDACGGGLQMTDGRSLGEGFVFDADGVRDYSDYQFEYGFYRFVFRRTLFAEAGLRFPPLIRFQDVPFFVKTMHAAGRFMALRRLAYLYRDGHRTVEWSAHGGVKARAHVEGLLMTYDLARDFGYDRMRARLQSKLLDFIGLLCSESNGLRTDLADRRAELVRVYSSRAYRLGERLAFPVRFFRDFFKGESCSSR